jgi:IS30 family transposase
MLWNEKVTSVTIDNGREFAKIMLLAKILSIEAFRCHPYSSWEK